MAMYEAKKIQNLKPLRDHVLVTDMNFDLRKTNSGILLLGDDRKLEGIHPRWARVYAVGPEQTSIRPGQYVLIKHGRWTRGIEIEDNDGSKVIRRIDTADVLLISDEPQTDEAVGAGL